MYGSPSGKEIPLDGQVTYLFLAEKSLGTCPMTICVMSERLECSKLFPVLENIAN